MTNGETGGTGCAVLGAGAMGGALARVLAGAGHSVTLWNRSHARAAALSGEGLRPVRAIEDAVAAGRLLIICVTDYRVARELLGSKRVRELLKGRTVVQFSTGAAAEARDMAGAVNALGADYLDGALMCYPEVIGTQEALIVYGGDKAVFDRAAGALNALGGLTTWLDEDPGSACTIDLALMSVSYSSVLGFLHGAALAEAGGLPLETFTALAVGGTSHLQGVFDDLGWRIAGGGYDETGAVLETHLAAIDKILAQSRADGVADEVPLASRRSLVQAVNRGLGRADLAAVFEMMRRSAARGRRGC